MQRSGYEGFYNPLDNVKAPAQVLEFQRKIPVNEQRQQRIMAAVVTGDDRALDNNYITIREGNRDGMERGTRNWFLRELAEGRYDRQMLQSLESVPDARERQTGDQILAGLRENPYGEDDPKCEEQAQINRQMRGILAHFSRGSLGERGNLTGADIDRFLQEHPNPAIFDMIESQQFIGTLEQAKSPVKAAQYQRSLQQLLPRIYGKRYDYYVQMRNLYAEAHNKFLSDKVQIFR